jgi:hypothetical protein
MHDPFNGGYGPELIKLMTQALDSAWRQSSGVSKDVELTRLVMANAIMCSAAPVSLFSSQLSA